MEMRLSLYDKYKLGMKKLSITQNELALEMGFTRSYVNMLVNGKRKNDQFDNWVKKNILPLFETKRSIFCIFKNILFRPKTERS